MTRKLTIIFFLISSIIYAQHTDRFKQFTTSIKPIDSVIVNEKFKNGKTKETGLILVYQNGDYLYEIYSGKLTKYYKSGIIKSIDVFDSYGNIITSKLFDNQGTPYCELKALKIDTVAKTIDEFFITEEHLSILIHSKRYRFSLIPNEWFLLEEGNYLNGTKTGKWTKYNKDGTVKQITNF